MKVKVKDISVHHSGAFFQEGDVLTIDPKDYRDSIFEVISEEEKPRKKAKANGHA